MEVHKIAIEKDMQKARDDLQKDIELLTQDVTNAIRQAITYIRGGKHHTNILYGESCNLTKVMYQVSWNHYYHLTIHLACILFTIGSICKGGG